MDCDSSYSWDWLSFIFSIIFSSSDNRHLQCNPYFVVFNWSSHLWTLLPSVQRHTMALTRAFQVFFYFILTCVLQLFFILYWNVFSNYFLFYILVFVTSFCCSIVKASCKKCEQREQNSCYHCIKFVKLWSYSWDCENTSLFSLNLEEKHKGYNQKNSLWTVR